MQLTNKLSAVGEHSFLFNGLVGQLEGVLTVPTHANPHYLALLGHPHPLQGGTMNNKVVTTMARAFKELGVASMRFNFRGVGKSDGTYDAGIGESEDMLQLMRYWQQENPTMRFLFAGFSFGSYVAYRAAANCDSELLLTIAPPVHHYDYDEFGPPNPWHIFQGDNDEVVPLAYILDFVRRAPLPLSLIRFNDTGHFFHGKLLELKKQLIDCIKLCMQP